MLIRKQITTVEAEIEVKFPSFYKAETEGVYYALLSERQAIALYGDKNISYSSSIALIDSCHEEITAEEFTRKFDIALETIQSFKSQFFNK